MRDSSAARNIVRNSLSLGPTKMNRLRADAGLSGIADSSDDGHLHRVLQVIILQDDKRIASAQFHRRFLQILAGARRQRFAGPFRSGQRDTSGTRIVDELRDLIVGQKYVGVNAAWRARLRGKAVQMLRRTAARQAHASPA